MFVSRVPRFFCAGVVRAKVDRRLKYPATLQDQRRIRHVARLHYYRSNPLRVITVDLVGGGTVNRFRSTTFSTLRLVTHAHRLCRRRRICREVCNDLALPRPCHLCGCLIRANDLAGRGHFAHLTYRTARQANEKAKACGKLKVGKRLLRAHLVARGATFTTFATQIGNGGNRLTTIFLRCVRTGCVGENAFANAKRAASARASKITQVKRALLCRLLHRDLILQFRAFRRYCDLTRCHGVAFRCALRVI